MTHVGEQVRRRGSMRHVLLVVALVITALFAYLAFEDAELGRTWAALANTRLEWLGPVLGVLTVALLLRALRWRSVFTGNRRPPLVDVVPALFVGYLFNSILPLRAGQPARVVALNRWDGVPIAEATGTPVVVSGYRLPRNGDLRVRATESRLGPMRHATGHVE
jgi:uncharacterized membrane protein YbhN (UPF0104 family)